VLNKLNPNQIIQVRMNSLLRAETITELYINSLFLINLHQQQHRSRLNKKPLNTATNPCFVLKYCKVIAYSLLVREVLSRENFKLIGVNQHALSQLLENSLVFLILNADHSLDSFQGPIKTNFIPIIFKESFRLY